VLDGVISAAVDDYKKKDLKRRQKWIKVTGPVAGRLSNDITAWKTRSDEAIQAGDVIIEVRLKAHLQRPYLSWVLWTGLD
jgi:hypothetical protein